MLQNEPVAVVGSPGLRSIGKLVIDSLINRVKPEIIAELFSTHFPLIYQTRPSYASHPRLPGIGGIQIDSGDMDLPKVQFYANAFPPLIITQGYHANFNGQYEVADKVLEFYNELQVRRIIVIAGYGLEGEAVCCAATNKKIIVEMEEKYGLKVGYEGAFYGFSGMIFGLTRLWGIEALCLFGRTEPDPNDPQRPDEESSKRVLDILVQILNLKTDSNSKTSSKNY